MIKRFLDILLSAIGLIILAPVCFVVALLIRGKMGSPIIFCQTRPGRDADLFTMYKFRTMFDEIGSDGYLLPDSERLNTLGLKLRSMSLDELPELWNVIKGEMSLVGPRPLLTEYLPLYSNGQARRHEVRPGVTGWAQVNGRNAISWDEKFALDVWYVDNRTIWLDFKIIWLTIIKVLIREGISAEGEVNMPKFTGKR